MRLVSRLLAPLVFMLTYALFRSSIQQRSRKKHDIVMRLFRFAADNGDVKALSVYGHLLHFRGDGVQNRIQGGIYLQQAAEKGEQKAQYQMGRIYEAGFEHYFQPSYAKALSFYQQAAEQGHQLAVRRMLDIYTQGELGEAADQHQVAIWRQKLPQL